MKLFTYLCICVAAFLPAALVAQTNSYTLEIADNTIELGQSVTVNWDTSASSITRDWVGLFVTGAGDRSYLDWEYTTTKSGDFTVTPTTPGRYEFRYFLNNGYERVAQSATVTVTPPPTQVRDYRLEIADRTVATNEPIILSIKAGGTSITRDWVGLYRTSASDRQFIEWKTVPGRNSNLTFAIDTPGTYEFRYFLNNGYERVATSETITVEQPDEETLTYQLEIDQTKVDRGERVTLSWNTNSRDNARDWIGLYRVGSSPNSYLDWAYVSGRAGTIDADTNRVGTYEFRYYLNNGYTLAATSDSFTVSEPEPDDQEIGDQRGYNLTPNKTRYERGETARVTWSVPQNTKFFRNWIGLYRPGDPDTRFIKFEYVDVFSFTETFRLDNDGTYEFRFFTNNSYNKVATSDPIVVVNDTSVACTLDTDDIANLPTPNGPIIALGDSITFGIGASTGEDYVSELEDRLGVNIINAGVSGDTTRDALERLEDDVLDRNPSAVIIFLGGNDEIRRFYAQLSDTLAGRNLQDELDELADDLGYDWMGVPLIPRQETFDNIETIIERIQDTGAATIVVGFDAAIYDSRIDDNYRQIARETDSFFVADIYDGIFGRPRFMSDLVHPNNAGYDIVADRIQPAVACVI